MQTTSNVPSASPRLQPQGIAEEGIISSFNTCPPLLSPGSRCQHCILEHWYWRTQSPQSGRPTAGIPFRHDPSPVYIAVHQWTEITPVPLTLPDLESFTPLLSHCPQLPSHAVPVLVPTIHGKQNRKTEDKKQESTRKHTPCPATSPLFYTAAISSATFSLQF